MKWKIPGFVVKTHEYQKNFANSKYIDMYSTATDYKTIEKIQENTNSVIHFKFLNRQSSMTPCGLIDVDPHLIDAFFDNFSSSFSKVDFLNIPFFPLRSLSQ